MTQQGSLSCVGLGMMLGAHVSPRSRSHIERADVVFALVSDPLVELWLQDMRPDLRSLQPYYAEGKLRTVTYHEMVDAMLAEVRAGRTVCGVFYGHPGVFAQVPHHAIEQARSEGFHAVMEPGISAEDCLYADLGIDPGTYGCQHYEASQFMLYHRRIDPSAYLVLWQIGIAGDRSLSRFATGPGYRRLLVELLMEDYPADHQVIAYEAATLPITTARMEGMPLSGIVDAAFDLQTTLVIPPARPMQRNQAMLDRLAVLDLEITAHATSASLHNAQGGKMSNRIRFLEGMEGDASSGRLSAEDYAKAVAQLNADDARQRAQMEREEAEWRASESEQVDAEQPDSAQPDACDNASDDERAEFVQNDEIHQAA